MSSVPPESAEPVGRAPESRSVRVRRAPRFSVFLVVGAIVGALVTLVVTSLFPVDPAIGFGPLYGYFAIYGVTIGVTIGAVIALILDRLSRRREAELAALVQVTDPLEELVERDDRPVEGD